MDSTALTFLLTFVEKCKVTYRLSNSTPAEYCGKFSSLLGEYIQNISIREYTHKINIKYEYIKMKYTICVCILHIESILNVSKLVTFQIFQGNIFMSKLPVVIKQKK